MNVKCFIALFFLGIFPISWSFANLCNEGINYFHGDFVIDSLNVFNAEGTYSDTITNSEKKSSKESREKKKRLTLSVGIGAAYAGGGITADYLLAGGEKNHVSFGTGIGILSMLQQWNSFHDYMGSVFVRYQYGNKDRFVMDVVASRITISNTYEAVFVSGENSQYMVRKTNASHATIAFSVVAYVMQYFSLTASHDEHCNYQIGMGYSRWQYSFMKTDSIYEWSLSFGVGRSFYY